MCLFLHALHFLTQLFQLALQLAAPLANITALLLGVFATLNLLGQCFRQLPDLLLDLSLHRLQFLGPCLKLGLFFV